MKKLLIVVAICMISFDANAGLFTYMEASSASNKARQANEKLEELEEEQQQIKEILVRIEERLKKIEKEGKDEH